MLYSLIDTKNMNQFTKSLDKTKDRDMKTQINQSINRLSDSHYPLSPTSFYRRGTSTSLHP